MWDTAALRSLIAGRVCKPGPGDLAFLVNHEYRSLGHCVTVDTSKVLELDAVVPDDIAMKITEHREVDTVLIGAQ